MELLEREVAPWVTAEHNGRVNLLEKVLVEHGKDVSTDMPVQHFFIPGFYIRQIFIPKGTVCTTKIHKTEHPFSITKGKVAVWNELEGTIILKAPHSGITKPGTRRVIFAHEDTVWTTFHATWETDLKKIESLIIHPHDIPKQLPA